MDNTPSYDMPLLLDDFEICKSDLGKALKVRGIELFQQRDFTETIYSSIPVYNCKLDILSFLNQLYRNTLFN
jgi:hypothetical protein